MRAYKSNARLRLAVLLASALFGVCNTQRDDCLTPRGKSGACVDLRSCPRLLDMLLYNRTDGNDQYLRNSMCERPQGYAVHVCCERPSCVTGDGRAGECVEPRACAASLPRGSGPCRGGRACCPRRRSVDGYMSSRTGLPEFGFCGVTEVKRSGNGTTTSPGEFPWTALLTYRAGGGETEMCAGALVGARFVITAAHCVQPQPVKIRLGAHNITERRGGSFETSVANVSVTPAYDAATRAGDLALIRLADPAPYTKYIRPICLPDRGIDGVLIDRLWTAGWGISADLPGSQLREDTLQTAAELPLRSVELCRKALQTWADLLKPHLKLDTSVPEGSLCAGGTFRSELCSQDSGGALLHVPPGGAAVALAVHARSIAGCRAPVPAVYTPLQPHLEWITGVMLEYYRSSDLRKRLLF